MLAAGPLLLPHQSAFAQDGVKKSKAQKDAEYEEDLAGMKQVGDALLELSAYHESTRKSACFVMICLQVASAIRMDNQQLCVCSVCMCMCKHT